MAPLRLLLIAAALLALPSAAASDSPIYLARSLEANGEAATVGGLAALYLVGPNEPAAVTLTLAAAQLRVETDRYATPIYPLPPGLGKDGWSQDTDNYTAATAKVTGQRNVYRIFIVPTSPGSAHAEVHAPLLQLVPASKDTVEDPSTLRHPDRAANDARVGGSLEMPESVGLRTVHVTGSFLAILWEVDLAVQGTDRTETYRSGDSLTEPIGPYEGNRTYAYVQDGTLELTASDATWESLFLHATGVAATGSITLHGALEQDMPAAPPADLRFPGPAACTLAASGNGIKAAFVPTSSEEPLPLSEAPDALDLLPSTAEGPAAGPSTSAVAWQGVPAWIGTSLLALALSAVGLLAARALSQSRAMRALRDLMAAGDYEGAIEAVEGLLRSRRHRREASVIGIVAALHLADVPRARDLLRRARWSLATDPALEPFLGACIAAASHDEERARELLQDSLRMDDSLAQHAHGNPFLTRVLMPEAQEPGYS